MKTINVTFEDNEFESLIKNKGNITWHDFILTNQTKKGENNEHTNKQTTQN